MRTSEAIKKKLGELTGTVKEVRPEADLTAGVTEGLQGFGALNATGTHKM